MTIQVTVLLTPITTVMELGLKEKFLMVTVAVLCAIATGGVRSTDSPARATIETNGNGSIGIEVVLPVNLCSKL